MPGKRPVGPLYLLRHGETDWNAVGRFQGRTDRPLNERGRAQAEIAAGVLKAEFARLGREAREFAFVASPLKRAGETMAIVANALGVRDVAVEPDIVEIAFGVWEGMTTHEVKAAFPAERRGRKHDRWAFRPDGGESFEDLAGRVERWLGRLDRPTVACTHAGVVRVLAYRSLGLAPETAAVWPVPHGEVFRVGPGSMEALR